MRYTPRSKKVAVGSSYNPITGRSKCQMACCMYGRPIRKGTVPVVTEIKGVLTAGQLQTLRDFLADRQLSVDELLQHPDKLKLGGEKKILTVLFSDIRGFTTLSEKLTPEKLVEHLNVYDGMAQAQRTRVMNAFKKAA